MVKTISLCAIFLIAGCASQEKKVEIQKVNIPVNYCPKPPDVNRPYLPLYSISDQDTPGDIVLKYEASIKALQMYAVDLETVIDFYKKNAKK